ncbi:ubiquinol-cytochrome c reductase complex subunit [Pseudozyma hubeiensis SY62]|uniref:Ubiquinol-cytochrome c reductase complex subunit n=1 Tax=Pseudozyma hubeiensis (strain SY62) TaxID=1305764 RepID=R9P7Q5_PSEHS|nr:ubiquinol-cytochrome c reductase complex subunit [Pseudozyma hubeiensis SY62]GAC97349.1 ubiquinol-cytochrome c reductase complex subunit [Pseudozyma hubeiensis SY62]
MFATLAKADSGALMQFLHRVNLIGVLDRSDRDRFCTVLQQNLVRAMEIGIIDGSPVAFRGEAISLPASGEESVFSSVSSFFSSLLPVAHAEEESSDDAEEESEDKESEGEDAEEEEEEEEEDEPEDPAPAIYEGKSAAPFSCAATRTYGLLNRKLTVLIPSYVSINLAPTDCEKSKACAPLKHHFDECTKRVEEGKGFEGENCIEEFFRMISERTRGFLISYYMARDLSLHAGRRACHNFIGDSTLPS